MFQMFVLLVNEINPHRFCFVTSFFLSSFLKLSHTEDAPHYLLYWIFENLPWEFAAGICRQNFPQKFAVAFCRENWPLVFCMCNRILFCICKIYFSKAKIKFCLSLHYNADHSYLFVNGKEIYKFKARNKNNNFPSQFCLGSISNEFDSDDLNEISFKGNVYDSSVDYSAVDKSNILSIHKYLMIKNRI